MHFFNQGIHNVSKGALPLNGFEIRELESELRRGTSSLGDDLFQPHRGEHYTILYIDKGAGWIELDFNRYQLHPGAFLFLSIEQVRCFDPAKLVGGFTVEFSADFIESKQDPQIEIVLSRLFDNQNEILDSRRHRELVMYFEMLLKEYNHAPDQLRKSVMNATLRLLVLHADRLNSASLISPDQKEIGYKYYLDFRSSIPQMLQRTRNANDYAEELGISYKYLNDLTKKFAGCTPKEIVDRALIAEAKRLIIEGQYSVGEISRKLGFDEPTNFRKYFKKHAGSNPTEFRQRQLT